MRYAVLSDIHSNLEALETVLAFLKDKRIDGTICCGDTVGYGPDPVPVLERLAALPNLRIVSGNHDLAALGKIDLEWFNGHAKAAVLWTRERLEPKTRAFLESMPARVEVPEFTAVHGSPRSPAEEYLLSSEQFLANIEHFKASPCFIGHSHLPVFFAKTQSGRVQAGYLKPGAPADVSAGGPWVLNPGSVGQPRDGDPRASFGVYDTAQKSFELFRLDYPIDKVQSKIRKAGLPELLAARLSFGE